MSRSKNEIVTPEKAGKGNITDITIGDINTREITTPVKSDGYQSHSSYDCSHDEEELSDTGLILSNEEKR